MAARQTAAEKRAQERAHEVALAAITRQPAPDMPQMETGETAAGREYIKSLKSSQQPDEGWKTWLDRHAAMRRYAKQLIADDEAYALEQGLQATVNVIEDERAKRRPRKKADES